MCSWPISSPLANVSGTAGVDTEGVDTEGVDTEGVDTEGVGELVGEVASDRSASDLREGTGEGSTAPGSASVTVWSCHSFHGWNQYV